MQRHKMAEIENHSRSTALEWSVNFFLGEGGGGGRGQALNLFYVATILALNSTVVSVQHLREHKMNTEIKQR